MKKQFLDAVARLIFSWITQSNNEIPKGFKIQSEIPVLVIEYNERKSLNSLHFFLVLIVLFLALCTLAGILWLSIEPLSTLQNRVWQPDFWQFQNGQKLSFDEKRFSIAGLTAIMFALLFPVLIIYNLIWSLFGISIFVASPDKLRVRHQLFFTSQTFSINKDSLLYFKHYEVRVKDQTKGWTLAAVKNQKNFFPSEIKLFPLKPFKSSYWLGRVLADFYQVELQKIN